MENIGIIEETEVTTYGQVDSVSGGGIFVLVNYFIFVDILLFRRYTG